MEYTLQWYTAWALPHPNFLIVWSPPYSDAHDQVVYNIVSIRVHPYAHPQHMEVLKHFVYIQYGYGIQSEVVYSLNHDTSTIRSFGLRLLGELHTQQLVLILTVVSIGRHCHSRQVLQIGVGSTLLSLCNYYYSICHSQSNGKMVATHWGRGGENTHAPD